ncbi:SH3 domain-containing protein [Streptomyces sp. MK7]|uniref:SH3 domain-containing protein n=1 Tax=Streptomyces sp. MK7 TaxID=3067635 RepID=UPI00292FE7F5|nr:SH3 domain-containing protein [Streptomyces sp. MK7]
MIRRTLTGGLLATVAMLALVPTAADAAPAAPDARPAAAVAERHLLPSLLPAPARHVRHWHHVNHHATHNRSSHPVGRVTTHRLPLNVRSGPGTGYRVIGVRHTGRLVALKCRTYGSWVRGTHQWYRLAHVRGYVSARYLRVRGAVPWC